MPERVRQRLIETAYEPFLRATVGRFTITGSSFVWCASPTLCGAFLWGSQTEEETRTILRIFDQYPQQMASSFDIVLDTRGVDRIDPDALAQLFSWLVARRAMLVEHLRMQANVIREGPIGFLLTGLLPVARWTLPYRIHHEPLEAFRSVAGEAGPALCAEIEAIAERVRGVPTELRITRELLGARLDLDVAGVARALGISARSLQRVLRRHGTSFHAELATARFHRAQAFLRSGDHKIAVIAARVGVSERGLTLLFRARAGVSPAESRRQHAQ
jgi:AraC-like DNA-binding protein